jgi:hypothetical protein
MVWVNCLHPHQVESRYYYRYSQSLRNYWRKNSKGRSIDGKKFNQVSENDDRSKLFQKK